MSSNAGSAEAREGGPVIRWTPLVERIRSGDDNAVQELYAKLSAGMRILTCRRLGAQDVHDRIHDVFIIVLNAIRSGSLREPEALAGFALAVLRNHIAACIGERRKSREQTSGTTALDDIAHHQHSPEDVLLNQERTDIAHRALKRLRPRDREILTRFYLQGQTEDRICEEMHLTSTQFRLVKSRAKAAFGEIGGRMIRRRPVANRVSGG
ncbi:MAG TPA: sigma-70 family RNA polymerase sigma factor [Bryobacteraceae bacterium]|nr:sigma-70 family RNA polymerase sigma factor [Bryobacteraceae bacterium]